MPDLFGIDIAGEIAKGFASAGNLVPGTLIQFVEGERASITDAPSKTEDTYQFQGFLERGERRLAGSRGTVVGDFVSILGASILDRTAPRVNDHVIIENERFELVELVERDPAAALYVFEVQGVR